MSALLTVVGIVLFGLMVTLAVPYFDELQVPGREPPPAPSSTAGASGTPKASTSPTPQPEATLPTEPRAVLRKNPIYVLQVLAACPEQSRPATRREFRSQVKGLLSCENAAWKKALAGGPVKFAKPKVVFYDTRTSSPCGRLGDTFPAAYCGSNRTMYFSQASFRQGRFYRLAVAQFVMHEYAHHVQELAGILDHRGALDESRAVSTRRVELQAHCMAHYQLTHSDLGFDSIDREQAEFQFNHTSDAQGHGSPKAERYWGRRGLDADSIGACNTWTVKAGKVR